MNFNEYEETVLKHAFYPNRGNNLPYATLGLTGEAGEVANIVKKIQRDDAGVITEEKRLKVKDELGDVLWYIAVAADEIGETLDTVAQHNVDKLAKRHGKNDKGEVTNTLEKFRKCDHVGNSGYERELCCKCGELAFPERVTNTADKFTASEMRFKVRDRVRVVDRIHGHHFPIGTIGTIIRVDPAHLHYQVSDDTGAAWLLRDSELKRATEVTEDVRHIRSKPFPF